MIGGLVKIDIEREIMAVDAPMHADQEAELLKGGLKQVDLWGINLYFLKAAMILLNLIQ